jgi:hypothetical protein
MKQSSSQSPVCQLGRLGQAHEPLSWIDSVWQFPKRINRIVKRRLVFISNVIEKLVHSPSLQSSNATAIPAEHFSTGDQVRVRSKVEIQATLSNWNDLKGCVFMQEMWQYCGTTQQVLKPIERFLDERDYHIKKIRDTVILAGINCQGTVDFGPCDRNCFFFWRTEWLEKRK